MQNPLVSVIMPAYNSNEFISQAIESVIAQQYKNWELIIVDDASKDATVNTVRNYVNKDARIKIFRNEINYGAGYSRNKAIKEAAGEFIAFLDADDLWKPEKLSQQLKFCLENKAKIVFSSYDRISENGESLNEIIEALQEWGLQHRKHIIEQ